MPAGTGSRSRPADNHYCAGAVLSGCCDDVTCSYHFGENPQTAAHRAFAQATGPSAATEAGGYLPDLARNASRS
ncbi:hypothetical protein GCM10020256_46390 [Streptomyces thermocoprophilus]